MLTTLIDAALMDSTWLSVGAASPTAIRKMEKQCEKEQPELTDFVVGFTSDLSPDAIGLALYVHLVVAQAFHKTGAKLRKIKPGRIDSTWKDNFAFIGQLKAAGHTCSPFTLPATLSSEPAVLQYIVDALTEENESDPVSLTVDEFWKILQVLKTYSDCMHDASARPGA